RTLRRVRRLRLVPAVNLSQIRAWRLPRKIKEPARQEVRYWRWPPYFRCLACAVRHPECTCGAYDCDHHQDCLDWAAEHPFSESVEDENAARPLLGLPPR